MFFVGSGVGSGIGSGSTSAGDVAAGACAGWSGDAGSSGDNCRGDHGDARGGDCGGPCGRASPRPATTGLLLLSHGSRNGDDRWIRNLADDLSPDVDEVAVCGLRAGPTPVEALRGLTAGVVHVVPLLMASGHVGNRVLSSMLPATERPRLRVHPPIGGSPALAPLIGRSVRHVAHANRLALARASVILIGHGNPSDPAAASAVHRLATSMKADGCEACEIHCAFLREPPFAERWQDLARCPDTIIVPCFLTAGTHLEKDLPALLHDTGDTAAAPLPKLPSPTGPSPTGPSLAGPSLAGRRRAWIAPPLVAHWHELADIIRTCITREPPHDRVSR